MILCQVVGTTVSTRKDPHLQGARLLIVVEVDPRGQPLSSNTLIVADVVAAGRGDIVLVATGSAAGNTPQTAKSPVDAAAIAIVDTVFGSGQVLYRSGQSGQSNQSS